MRRSLMSVWVNIQRAIHSGVLDGDSMNKYLKIVLFGFILWLVPFIAGFFFIDAKGNFLIPETFFKSIMIVVGSLVSVILAVRYLTDIGLRYLSIPIYTLGLGYALKQKT
jgi:hypothetical protein